MTDADLLEIAGLIGAPDAPSRERAWERLLARYTRLLLKVSRSLDGNKDTVMDRYAYVVEQLREDDFRRLRAFRPDGPARFSTWLVVAARRLCVDHHRARFGRAPFGATQDAGRALRRRLVLGEGAAVDLAALPDQGGKAASEILESNDLARALQHALDTLASGDRLLLQLRFRDDLSARAIAAILGLPTPFHVYRRINMLTALLRERLRAFDDQR